MKRQITHISPHQSAKVIAGLYALLISPAILVGVFGFLGSLLFKQGILQSLPFLFLILAPFIYGFFAYILFGLFALLYNFLAKHIGGIEFVVTDLPEA